MTKLGLTFNFTEQPFALLRHTHTSILPFARLQLYILIERITDVQGVINYELNGTEDDNQQYG